MTLEEAITELTGIIKGASPNTVIRVTRVSDEEASMRAYAPSADEHAVKDATQEPTIRLLTEEGLDVQVLVYNLETDLPPE